MGHYFISFIWWHRKYTEDKEYAETVTDMTPIQWLMDMREDNKKRTARGVTELEKMGEEIHILYAYEISRVEYETYNDELS